MNGLGMWDVRVFEREGGRWFCLDNGALYVAFMEKWAWTIRNIKHMGDEIVGEYGAHGSVVRMEVDFSRCLLDRLAAAGGCQQPCGAPMRFVAVLTEPDSICTYLSGVSLPPDASLLRVSCSWEMGE